MGPFKGLKEVRRVVEDTMQNIHPIYMIKELMYVECASPLHRAVANPSPRIKRELAKDPALAHEDWSRYLPNFKKRNLSHRRKPLKVTDKSKKVYTPFPPAPEKSKVDLQIESGEYFLGKEAKQRAAEAERAEKARQKKEEKKREREGEFVPPEENGVSSTKPKKRKTSHE